MEVSVLPYSETPSQPALTTNNRHAHRRRWRCSRPVSVSYTTQNLIHRSLPTLLSLPIACRSHETARNKRFVSIVPTTQVYRVYRSRDIVSLQVSGSRPQLAHRGCRDTAHTDLYGRTHHGRRGTTVCVAALFVYFHIPYWCVRTSFTCRMISWESARGLTAYN